MRDHGPAGGQRARRHARGGLLVPLAGLLVAAVACSGALINGALINGSAPARATEPVNGQVLLAAASTPAAGLTDVVAQIDAMGATGPSKAEYGIAVLDRRTGQLTLGEEGAVPFYSASVVKLFTVVDILHRADIGAVSLTDTQRTQIQRALRVSDNEAMNALWEGFGGSRTVTELVGLARLRDTRPPEQPGAWGNTKLSPRDVVAVYQYALTKLSPANRDLVLSSLATPGTAGADGFNQSFGVLRTPGLPGAAGKQGWMRSQGNLYLHSTGMVGTDHRYLVAMLSKQSASVGYPAGRQRLDAAMGAVASALGLLKGAAGVPANSL
jgi:hypothetical protein